MKPDLFEYSATCHHNFLISLAKLKGDFDLFALVCDKIENLRTSFSLNEASPGYDVDELIAKLFLQYQHQVLGSMFDLMHGRITESLNGLRIEIESLFIFCHLAWNRDGAEIFRNRSKPEFKNAYHDMFIKITHYISKNPTKHPKDLQLFIPVYKILSMEASHPTHEALQSKRVKGITPEGENEVRLVTVGFPSKDRPFEHLFFVSIIIALRALGLMYEVFLQGKCGASFDHASFLPALQNLMLHSIKRGRTTEGMFTEFIRKIA